MFSDVLVFACSGSTVLDCSALSPIPAEMVSPALTIAANGSVESEKTPMPMKIKIKNRPSKTEDTRTAEMILLVDKPSSSLSHKRYFKRLSQDV